METEIEKLETAIKELKKTNDEAIQAGTQNESLTKSLNRLEEEAEQADKLLREANEKYVPYKLDPSLLISVTFPRR